MNANITLTRGTHKLDIEDKKNIKYTLNGEEKSIEIDISDLTSKTTNDERKDYIKTQIENAFSLKSLSIDETSLKVLVKKMFDENPPPGAGGGGTP